MDQLAQQDYPVEQIREILVRGAESLKASAPEALRPLLRELGGEPNKIASHLDECSGDVVAIWSDDHISLPSRLCAQVSAALAGGTATVLQRRWYYDALDREFLFVDDWAADAFEESMGFTGSEVKEIGLPDGYGELVLTGDSFTLCGPRATLVKAASKLDRSESASDELTKLETFLYTEEQPPQLLQGMEWASLAPLPDKAKWKMAKPEIELKLLTESTFPKGSLYKEKSSLDEIALKIRDSNMQAVDAVRMILGMEPPSQAPTENELRRLERALSECLIKSTGADANAALQVVLAWPGFQPGQGDAKAASYAPLVYRVVIALREHVRKDGDMFYVEELGPLAEGFVKVAQLMWSCDPKVSERVSFYTTQDLYRNDLGDEAIPTVGASAREVIASMGMVECLTNIGYAAQETPGVRFNVQALASLTYGLAEANVRNKPLSTKVAKALIADCDKLRPPDIGKIFVALHERKWFQDPMAEGYLTESLVAQIQNLKKEDEGLAQMIAADTAAQEAAAAAAAN